MGRGFQLNVNSQAPDHSALYGQWLTAIDKGGDQELAALGILNDYVNQARDRKAKQEDITMQFGMEKELIQERARAKQQSEMMNQMVKYQVQQQKDANFQAVTQELTMARDDLLRETNTPLNELDSRFDRFSDLGKKEFGELMGINNPGMTTTQISSLFDIIHGKTSIKYIDEESYTNFAGSMAARYGEDSLDGLDRFEGAYPLGRGEAIDKQMVQMGRIMGIGRGGNQVDGILAALTRSLDRRNPGASDTQGTFRQGAGLDQNGQPPADTGDKQLIQERLPEPPLLPGDAVGLRKPTEGFLDKIEGAESAPEPVSATALTALFNDFSFGMPNSPPGYVKEMLGRGIFLSPHFNEREKDQVDYIQVGTTDNSVPREVLENIEKRLNRDGATQAQVVGLMMSQGKKKSLGELGTMGAGRMFRNKVEAPEGGFNSGAESILSGGGLLKYK